MYNILEIIEREMEMKIETEIIKIDKNNLDKELLKKAGDYLSLGKLVAFPTETVYGLGADGLNEEAVKKIFKAKGRPQDNPLILHIDTIEMVEKLAIDISEDSFKLINKYWPGPLTLILKRSKLVPDIITGGLDTVAVRMPDNEIAREIIKNSHLPIAAPSANTSGRPSPTTAEHVYMDLENKIDLIIDGGSTGIGLESTVLDMSGDTPTILRPGAITLEEIKTILPNVIEDEGLIIDEKIIPKSPGQKYTHYAPKKDMILFSGTDDFIVNNILEYIKKYHEEGKKVGIIGTDENINKYNGDETISLGSKEDKENIAHNLFKIYRYFDDKEIDIILSETVDEEGLGKAIMNRMIKASGNNIIKENI